jgi:hypothetical protein
MRPSSGLKIRSRKKKSRSYSSERDTLKKWKKKSFTWTKHKPELVEIVLRNHSECAREKEKKSKQKNFFLFVFIILHNNSLVEFEWRVNVYLIIVWDQRCCWAQLRLSVWSLNSIWSLREDRFTIFLHPTHFSLHRMHVVRARATSDIRSCCC